MKTLRIIEREVLVRTGFKKNPYKKERQVTIIYGKEHKAENHLENIDNPKLKVKFVETFKTRSKARLQEYIARLGKTDVEKWMKQQLEWVVNQ